jgi:hypothetical protein
MPWWGRGGRSREEIPLTRQRTGTKPARRTDDPTTRGCTFTIHYSSFRTRGFHCKARPVFNPAR